MASDISIESGPIAQRLRALAGTVPLSVLLVDDDELEHTFLGDQLQDASFNEGSAELERGYLAGVDDYLTKKVHQTELLARINTAFSTYALRRELRSARDSLDAAHRQLSQQRTGS